MKDYMTLTAKPFNSNLGSVVMRDNIKKTLFGIKGVLILDGVFLGEVIIDRIYLTESGFIALYIDPEEILSLKLFSSECRVPFNFRSPHFHLKCNSVSFHVINNQWSTVIHRPSNPDLEIYVDESGV